MGDRIKPDATAASPTRKGQTANLNDHQSHPAAPRVDERDERTAIPTQQRRTADTETTEP